MGTSSVAILRESGGQRALVALNPSGSPDRISVPASLGLGGLRRLELSGDLADGVSLGSAPDGSVRSSSARSASLVALV